MKNIKFIVKTKSKTYPIYFGNNILNKTGWLIKKNLPNVKKNEILNSKNNEISNPFDTLRDMFNAKYN